MTFNKLLTDDKFDITTYVDNFKMTHMTYINIENNQVSFADFEGMYTCYKCKKDVRYISTETLYILAIAQHDRVLNEKTMPIAAYLCPNCGYPIFSYSDSFFNFGKPVDDRLYNAFKKINYYYVLGQSEYKKQNYKNSLEQIRKSFIHFAREIQKNDNLNYQSAVKMLNQKYIPKYLGHSCNNLLEFLNKNSIDSIHKKQILKECAHTFLNIMFLLITVEYGRFIEIIDNLETQHM